MLKLIYILSKNKLINNTLKSNLILIHLESSRIYENNNNNLNIIKTLKDKLNTQSLLIQKSTSSYLFFLNYYLIILLRNKISKNIFLNLLNYNKDITPFINIFKKIKNTFKKTIILRRLKISLKELSWVFFILLKYKDINLFKSWLKFKFISVKLKFHKSLISLLKYTIKNIIPSFFPLFSLLGMFFSVRGKISSSGSSKKRYVSFSYGITSKNKKYIRTNLSNLTIKTSTGTLGLNFGIFY